MPRARECVTTYRFPNGDFRRLRDDATSEVIAISRDQVKLRVGNTTAYSATATRGKDRIQYECRWREDPRPNYRIRGLRAGASGHLRQAQPNPACGSADLFRTPSAASSLSGSFPWCRGKAACAAKLPGPRARTSRRAKPVWRPRSASSVGSPIVPIDGLASTRVLGLEGGVANTADND